MSLSAAPRWTWLGRLNGLVVLLLSAAVGAGVHALVQRQTLASLDDTALRQLDLYAAALDGELGKHAYLPSLLEEDPDVLAALDAGQLSVGRREALSRKLARLNVRAGSMTLFVMTPTGRVIASSDWFLPDSLYGQNLDDRLPLLTWTGAPSIHLFERNADNDAGEFSIIQPVRDTAMRGWIGVKVSLGPLEATWRDLSLRAGSEKVLVTDRHGLIVMASNARWTQHMLAPMAAPPQPVDRLGTGTGIHPVDGV